MIATSKSDEIFVWDTSGNKAKELKKEKVGIVTSVVFASDSKKFYIGSLLGTVLFFDTANLKKGGELAFPE